jgi:hypothetical protein
LQFAFEVLRAMPIAYDFDERIVVLRLEGEYTSAEAEDAVLFATTDPACPPDPVLLVDLRNSRSFPRRRPEDIRATARFLIARRERFGNRIGVVAESDIPRESLETASAILQAGGVATATFRDPAPARAWLLADAPSAQSALTLAKVRAATSRQGSARCISDAASGWLVVSEQPTGAGRWSLLVDMLDGQASVSVYPAQWMLLSEAALLELVVGARSGVPDELVLDQSGAFTMRLAGFEAIVSYDERAERFRGEVINSRTPVEFTGRDAGELRSAFQRAIEGLTRATDR